MYLIFNLDGTFVMMSNVIPSSHDNENYLSVKVDEFDPKYEYTLIDGKVVKGDLIPIDEAEINRINQEFQATQYQRDRVLEYPSFADQFDLLYHGGYDAWKSKIEEVKNKYPKP